MSSPKLNFVGIKGAVVALNEDTGAQVWSVKLKGSDFVNVVLDSGRLYALTYGEIWCLDPADGAVVWHNPLTGFGLGLATIATENIVTSGQLQVIAEQRRRQAQAQQAATTAAAT